MSYYFRSSIYNFGNKMHPLNFVTKLLCKVVLKKNNFMKMVRSKSSEIDKDELLLVRFCQN